jgi:hypothetical protein
LKLSRPEQSKNNVAWHQGSSGLVLKDSTSYGKPVLKRSTCEVPCLELVAGASSDRRMVYVRRRGWWPPNGIVHTAERAMPPALDTCINKDIPGLALDDSTLFIQQYSSTVIVKRPCTSNVKP